jgi:DNA-directed RNA polymerase subunit alpha
MLSNIPGASVFAIRIPGVTHEFQTINGVKEDVTQIVLNLKGLVIVIDENIHSDDELAALRVEQ